MMITRTQLAYFIAPKSGPVRRMETLHDATQALLNDLPYGFQKPRHWLDAGLLVVRASETGLRADILRATDALFDALSHEGWLERNSVSEGDQRPDTSSPLADRLKGLSEALAA
jgi:hypothetical protein